MSPRISSPMHHGGGGECQKPKQHRGRLSSGWVVGYQRPETLSKLVAAGCNTMEEVWWKKVMVECSFVRLCCNYFYYYIILVIF